MAKARFSKGLRRGSTKSETYSTLTTAKDGKVQIIKDRVTDIANPQTDAQMQQRVAFVTASQAAAIMKDIVDISREGIAMGTFARQQFVSDNAALLRQLGTKRGNYAAFSPKGNKMLIPNSYIMSRGSLVLPAWAKPVVRNDGQDVGSFEGPAFKSDFHANPLPYGNYTVAQLWQTVFGVRPGDQITFPQIRTNQYISMAKATEDNQGNITYDDVVKATWFAAPRIVLLDEMPSTTLTVDANTTTSAFQTALESGVNLAKSNEELVSNFISNWAMLAGADDQRQVSMADSYDVMCAVGEGTTLAVCCILSHKASNGWQYTTSQMVCVFEPMSATDPAEDSPAYFGYTMWDAMQSYKTTKKVADRTFLQTATNNNVVPQDFQ